MEVKLERKELTKAQTKLVAKKFQELNELRRRTQKEFDDIVDYLREEHGLDETWILADTLNVFVRPLPPKETDTTESDDK